MKQLKNKVVVITGAGSGIGRALALQFSKESCHLAINDFNEAALDETISLLNKSESRKVVKAVFDVSDKTAFKAFANKVESEYGQVDVMINNAGVALGKISIDKIELEDFEWLMGINFWGMVYGSKFFLPLLKKQKEAALLNVSSIFGFAGIAYQGAYCSSKFAIRGFTESLMQESMIDFPNVTIHSIHPGGIKTNIAAESKNIDPEMDEAEEKKVRENFEKMLVTAPSSIAEHIIDCIRKKKKRIVFGHRAKGIDWLTRMFPQRYHKMIVNEIKSKGIG